MKEPDDLWPCDETTTLIVAIIVLSWLSFIVGVIVGGL